MSDAQESLGAAARGNEMHVCPGCAGVLSVHTCGVYFDKVTYADFESMPIFRRMTGRFQDIRSEFRQNYPNLSFAGMQNAVGAYVDSEVAEEAKEFFEGYNKVDFGESDGIKTARLSQTKSDRAVSLIPLTSSSPACPNCGFVLPVDFFQRKMIYIGLLGASSSGKTVAISVLARKDYDCLNYSDQLNFSGVFSDADPGYASLYSSYIQDIDQGILPGGTLNTRIPPLLVKMDMEKEDGSSARYLIAFVDAAGEALTSKERIGFLNYCNGYLVAIEAQGVFADIRSDTGEKKPRLQQKNPRLLAEDEQRSLAEGAEPPQKPAIREMKASSFVRSAASAPAQYSVTNPVAFINLLNSISFPGRRAIAICLTKADLMPKEEESYAFLMSNGRYRQGEKGRFVFDFDRFGKKNQIVKDILYEKGITLHIDHSKYVSGYFAISATGKQPMLKKRGEVDIWQRDRTESVYFCESISPKNLYEPFMWLILNTLKDNGDLT
ncbi:MAG: hypothetical protein LBC69_02655 [Eubacteriaceae bacterium]|jgi:hypothetical protein|nr:hypothetical protein [Eubacteriaceae bacterium]